MVKINKLIDYYEISINVLIEKKYWDADNDKMNAKIIADKVQQGIEVPIEEINIVIK